MKNRIILFLTAGLMTLFNYSCEKESDPVYELPEWNRNRTTTVQVVSTFTNTPILLGGVSAADFTDISNRIRSGTQSVTLLHRADATMGSGAYNPAISMGAKSLRVPLFALHRFSGQKVEGTGVLINHSYVRSEITMVADGCSFLKVDTRANAFIPMTFATVSFDSQSHLEAGAAAIRNNMTDATVVAGLVKKDLSDQLKAKFSDATYRFSTAEIKGAQSTQVIFVVSSKKWVLRDFSENMAGSGTTVVNLQIEAL